MPIKHAHVGYKTLTVSEISSRLSCQPRKEIANLTQRITILAKTPCLVTETSKRCFIDKLLLSLFYRGIAIREDFNDFLLLRGGRNRNLKTVYPL